MPAMTVSRSIEINAPIETVFDSLHDFKEWPRWSPWLIAEPDCEVSHAPDGKSYSWDGKYIGSGEMELIGETESTELRFDLRFLKPWKSQADVKMSLESTAESGTRVTWSMDSSLPFVMFWMKGMMEALIGMDYQRGLAMLKDLLETGEVPVKLEFAETKAGPFSIVGIRNDCSLEAMPKLMAADAEKICGWLAESGTGCVGKMMTVYHKWDPAKGRVIYTIGFPFPRVPENLPGFLTQLEIPGVSVATVQQTGPYHHLGNAWSSGFMRSRGGAFKQNKKVHPFEIYENSPDEVSENELVTTVHFPMKG